MGIKGWLTVGGVILTGVAVWLGLKKKEDEHYERIQKIIRNVDRKEVKEKTVEDLASDVEEIATYMDINEIEENHQDVEKSAPKVIDNSVELKLAQERKEEEQRKKELEEKMKDPEWLAEQHRLEQEQKEKAEAEWRRKVKKAVEQRNWSRLEDLFDEKYSPYPYHPAPSSVFGQARAEGVISDEIYDMAEEHFGRLWNYSGD